MSQFRYCAVSNPGRVRGNNEDNYYINGNWRRDVSQQESRSSGSSAQGHLLASVCDGMGGYSLGEVASLFAVEEMASFDLPGSKKNSHPFISDLSRYVERANQRICSKMRETGERTGTTMCAAEFSNRTVICTNIGDSRVYCYRGGALTQLSMDHSVVARMVRQGQLTAEQARVHPRRHQISQYLGIPENDIKLEPFVSKPVELRAGDRFLLCSDGLTDMLEDAQICSILQSITDTDQAAEELVRAALHAGGKDNVTVVLVDVVSVEGERVAITPVDRGETTISGGNVQTSNRTFSKGNSNTAKSWFKLLWAGIGIGAACFLLGILGKDIFFHKAHVTVLNGTGTGVYQAGKVVEISADVPEGYQFEGWNVEKGDAELEDKSASITKFVMPHGDVMIAASFIEETWMVSVNEGTIGLSASAEGHFPEGDNVCIVADPAPEGKHFDGWSVITGNVQLSNSGERSACFEMPAENVEISALYEDDMYHLKLESSEIEGQEGQYAAGEQIHLVAGPISGKQFICWEIECEDESWRKGIYDLQNPELNFSMPAADVTVRSIYDPEEFVVQVENGNENGNGKGLYSPGSDVWISANAAPVGMHFERWDTEPANIEFRSSTETACFIMPEENVKVKAIYAENTYDVTVINGFISDKTHPGYQNASFPAGSIVEVFPEPEEEGKHFVGWTVEIRGENDQADKEISTSKDRNMKFCMPSADVLLRAQYDDNTYEVLVAGGKGDGVYREGEMVVLKAGAEKDGIVFDRWKVLKGNIEIIDPYDENTEFAMPSEKVEVRAVFKRIN